MSFWRGETLTKRLPSLVDPFDSNAIDCAAYTLRVGSEIYVSPDRQAGDPSRQSKERLDHGQGFTIPPGQFAFLLSAESITIPNNAIAFISIKARLKFGGLINISGFHVDPGYRGKLLFSVLNAGPKPLHLTEGQPLFLIWFADLDGETEMQKCDEGFDGIEPQLVNGISGEIRSLQSLSDEQRALEKRMDERLNVQTSQVSNLRTLVTIFLSLLGATIVGLVGWGLRGWLGGGAT